jgi:DNA modification methylase
VITAPGRHGRVQQRYRSPAIANPGNVVFAPVGGARMGSPLSRRNEAPYPESLVKPFVLSFCKPGGVVLDPFVGSGTTAAVALRHGRRCIGIDIRHSQTALTAERCGKRYR